MLMVMDDEHDDGDDAGDDGGDGDGNDDDLHSSILVFHSQHWSCA